MRQGRKILFLCTGNSCRSQMAEGWARHLLGSQVEPYSAGTLPGALDPRAASVMAETGVAIDHQVSKSLDALAGIDFDLVVTVCDTASEACPVFPGGTRMVHFSFDDPPRLAAGATSDDEALSHYRRVRDEVRSFVESLPDQFIESKEPRP